MNRQELRQKLRVSDHRISTWLAEGLPHTRKTPRGPLLFDADQVAQWLVAHDYAEPQDTVDSIDQLASHFKRTTRSIRGWARQGMPGDTVGPWSIAAVETWREARRELTGADPLLAGPASPALERYREARAKIAELDVKAREGSLLPREQIHEWLGRLAFLLRRAAEQLQQRCGDEAHRILDETLDDFDRELRALGTNSAEESDGQAAENPPA